jgi:hypothetical protein
MVAFIYDTKNQEQESGRERRSGKGVFDFKKRGERRVVHLKD